jgi:hypothetical protein
MKDSHRTDGIGRLLARCGRVSLLAAGCIGVVLVLLVAVLFGILGVCLLFPGWRASWLPGVLLLGVCAVVAWLAIMAARGVLRWFRKPVAPCDVSPPPLPGICPACGEADLYRAAGSTALPWSIFTARCEAVPAGSAFPGDCGSRCRRRIPAHRTRLLKIACVNERGVSTANCALRRICGTDACRCCVVWRDRCFTCASLAAARRKSVWDCAS